MRPLRASRHRLEAGDAEYLPYPDASFDVVVSQFGHMFAPRPATVVAEMRRVLKPVAGWRSPPGRPSTWWVASSRLSGAIRATAAGAAPPAQWGDPALVAQRLGERFGPPSMSAA